MEIPDVYPCQDSGMYATIYFIKKKKTMTPRVNVEKFVAHCYYIKLVIGVLDDLKGLVCCLTADQLHRIRK